MVFYEFKKTTFCFEWDPKFLTSDPHKYIPILYPSPLMDVIQKLQQQQKKEIPQSKSHEDVKIKSIAPPHPSPMILYSQNAQEHHHTAQPFSYYCISLFLSFLSFLKRCPTFVSVVREEKKKTRRTIRSIRPCKWGSSDFYFISI